MAKCPKCERKKGKRFCPALDTSICATCCAEHRLTTIPCPQDCAHLGAEYYQRHRRRERAQSAGRALRSTLGRLLYSRAMLDFAFQVLADAYWWHRRHKRPWPPDDAMADALEGVSERLSALAMPTSGDALVAFLVELCRRGRRHADITRAGLEPARRRDALTILARHIRERARGSDPEGAWFVSEVCPYFDALDFEADLDYSPAEELADGRSTSGDGAAGSIGTFTGGSTTRPSGLVVPRE